MYFNTILLIIENICLKLNKYYIVILFRFENNPIFIYNFVSFFTLVRLFTFNLFRFLDQFLLCFIVLIASVVYTILYNIIDFKTAIL